MLRPAIGSFSWSWRRRSHRLPGHRDDADPAVPSAWVAFSSPSSSSSSAPVKQHDSGKRHASVKITFAFASTFSHPRFGRYALPAGHGRIAELHLERAFGVVVTVMAIAARL
jgi:hypothetical protein